MVDWFDSDQRRFVLAGPNPPELGNPRGLTERELQVATYAALGESGKLAVKTQPQLAEKMRGLAGPLSTVLKRQSGP